MKHHFINQFYRDPATAAALIGAGVTAASQGANAAIQGKMNLRTRQFAEEMYFRQRADALSDWERNLPKNVMQRFEEAGLNKNLIYGNGAEAQPVRASPTQSWNPKAPEFDGGAIAGKYFDTKMQLAQQDLMQKQMQVLDTDIAQKSAVTRGIEIDNAQKSALNPYSLQAAEQNIKHVGQQMDIELQRNAREALTNNASLLNAAADLTNKNLDTLLKKQEQATQRSVQNKLQAEIDVQRQILQNLKTEGQLKKMDINFKTDLPPGSQPGDNFMMRKLQELINAAKEFVDDPGGYLKNKFVPMPHR